MKYALLVCRILLGALFLFSGANLILHFMHPAAMPGEAGELSRILDTTGWMKVVGLLQVVGGLLLLVGRFVPLALTILAPIIVNIFLFHALLAPQGIPIAIVVAVLEVFLIFTYRVSFRGLFSAGTEVVGTPKI